MLVNTGTLEIQKSCIVLALKLLKLTSRVCRNKRSLRRSGSVVKFSEFLAFFFRLLLKSARSLAGFPEWEDSGSVLTPVLSDYCLAGKRKMMNYTSISPQLLTKGFLP